MEQISQIATNLVSQYGYIFMAFAMFVDSVNIPAGSEIILPFGGYMARTSNLNIYVLIAVTTIATTLGAIANYYLGAWGGDILFAKHGKKLLISKKDYDLAVNWFKKYGNFAAFFGRLIPGIRTFISFPAGVAKTSIIPFSVYSFLGSLVWCTGFCAAGYALGKKWKTIEIYLKDFHLIIIAILVIIIVLYIIHKIKDRNEE
ncbi:MAG: DedA family protein [Deltaproteobacteria bacterium]